MAGIEKPWILERVEVDESKDLHMYVKYKRGEKFKCNQCQELCPVHDTIDKTWRHWCQDRFWTRKRGDVIIVLYAWKGVLKVAKIRAMTKNLKR